MAYVNHGYYLTAYQGRLSEHGFNKLATQASALVDYYTFNRIVEAGDDVKMAVCELVDHLADFEEQDGKEILSESVGTQSVTYSDKFAQSPSQKQQQIIRKYLGHTGLMYRGVR